MTERGATGWGPTERGPTGQGVTGQSVSASGEGPREGETKGTVYVALAANLVIAAAKVAGGIVSGSSALLSEAAHSVADSLNEIFLLPRLMGEVKGFWVLL